MVGSYVRARVTAQARELHNSGLNLAGALRGGERALPYASRRQRWCCGPSWSRVPASPRQA